jgi:hypothetical protein
MFENQTPVPTSDPLPKPPEDIFATVESGGQQTSPFVKVATGETATSQSVASPGLEPTNSNHLLVIIGTIVGGLLVLAVGVWLALAIMGAKNKVATPPVVDNTAQVETTKTTAEQVQTNKTVSTPSEQNLGVATTSIENSTTTSGLATATVTTSASLSTTSTPAENVDLDTDHDGLTDAQEAKYGTNPLKADTDGDGLTDGEEVKIYGTDPLKADTDGDGYSDGEEVKKGYNPNGPGKLIMNKATSSLYKNE